MTDPLVTRFPLLERQAIYTLLGVRFWDRALDEVVRDGLQVTAWPEGRTEVASTAFRKAAGVYTFRDLACAALVAQNLR
jgi:hypothetical protein